MSRRREGRGALVHPTAVIGSPPEHRSWITGTSGYGVTSRPDFEPYISPTARISAFVTVDAGCEHPTTIAERVLVLAHAHVGHDVTVCEDATIGSGAILGGHAIIGCRAQVGIGAVVLPYRIIAADATVGAGAVVTADVPPGATVAGNPARIIDPSRRVHSLDRVSVREAA